MRMLKRAVMSAAVSVALATGLASAQSLPIGGGAPATDGAIELQIVKNAATGYQMGFPTTWGVVTGSEGNDFASGPTDGSIRSVCYAWTIANPNLPDDDTLRQIVAAGIPEDIWMNIFFSDFPNSKITSSGANANHEGGWPVAYAVGEFTTPDGVKLIVSVQMAAKFKTQYMQSCGVVADDEAKAKPFFQAIYGSFKITRQ